MNLSICIKKNYLKILKTNSIAFDLTNNNFTRPRNNYPKPSFKVASARNLIGLWPILWTNDAVIFALGSSLMQLLNKCIIWISTFFVWAFSSIGSKKWNYEYIILVWIYLTLKIEYPYYYNIHPSWNKKK